MIKILLVDDHDLMRHGIHHLLSGVKGLQVIAQAQNGEEAIKFAKELHPDVIVMDVQMPGMGGIEATRKILRYDPEAKILILTVCDQDSFTSRLLDVGAAGYVSKGCEIKEILQAIRAVHAGERYISADIAQKLILRRFSNKDQSRFDALSERELQVLLRVASGQTVREIADKLFLSTKTVNTYRYHIFEKLNVSSDVEMTLLAIRLGLVDAESVSTS